MNWEIFMEASFKLPCNVYVKLINQGPKGDFANGTQHLPGAGKGVKNTSHLLKCLQINFSC